MVSSAVPNFTMIGAPGHPCQARNGKLENLCISPTQFYQSDGNLACKNKYIICSFRLLRQIFLDRVLCCRYGARNSKFGRIFKLSILWLRQSAVQSKKLNACAQLQTYPAPPEKFFLTFDGLMGIPFSQTWLFKMWQCKMQTRKRKHRTSSPSSWRQWRRAQSHPHHNLATATDEVRAIFEPPKLFSDPVNSFSAMGP